MAHILGVDVHAAYGDIAWARARAAGVQFAIAKCSYGNEPQGDDRSFVRNVAGAKAAGIYVGAYHFAMPLRHGPGKPAGRDPVSQAQRAWEVSTGLGAAPGELPPALDLEWPPHFETVHDRLVDKWAQWDVTAESIAGWALEYLNEMEHLSGRVPLLYTYPDFWRSLGAYGKVPEFSRYPLWIATYPESCKRVSLPPEGVGPIIPAPWTREAIWQFSAGGSPMRIDGIPACPIDRDVFRGSPDDLRRLAGVDPTASTEPPPSAQTARVEVPEMRPGPLEAVKVNDFAIVHPSVLLAPDSEPPDSAA